MSSPLRVAGPHLYRLAEDSDVGGEVYERMLAERLSEHGVALRLGLPRDHALRPPPPGVQTELPGHDSTIHWSAAPRILVPYLIKLIRREPPEVLRGHSVRGCGPSLLLARTLTRTGARLPIVLHHHHFFPRWRALEAAILRAADQVITVSEHSRRELTDAGVAPERIQVAHNGVAGPPRSAPAPGLWPDPDGLRLLHVGRLETRKRPALAIETLARLPGPASLVLAGEGPERRQLERLAGRLGLTERIRFLGRVPPPLKWQLYDSAEVLLFGSTLEGFGLVVAEAQSRGLPVIAAAGAATAEALIDGATGLLRSPEPPAFAAAVEAIRAPATRAGMGARAAEFARRFDWDGCAAAVADAYRRVKARC